ncbi:SRPBCC family protein [Lysobacter enzymogenes]|uniref:SRPBCC family protein n=1 Tax=Lysobacter enzymogenes TaxID=69 RepID=UPI001A967E54|nr:SRPBCC domain-containing protein [Lysobacter enzymogenes]QQP98434.1 SRPBCC domain-containing protein [Lysobacter enzymogenes]
MVDILHKIATKAPMEKVYDALATREGISAWWTTTVEGDSQVGRSLTFRFYAGDNEIGAFEMNVLELDPGKRVSWQVAAGPQDWIGTKIGFDLKQEGEYAVVLFKHEGWREASESMHHCSTKWAIFLMSLKAYLETGTGRPSPDDVKIDNWN